MARILLVEDKPDIREVVALYLSTVLGHQVVEAGDGQEAINLIQGGFIPNLVISDVRMPGMCGAALLRELREGMHMHIPIIIYSGGYDANQHLVIQQHATRVLQKPARLRDLGSLVTQHLAA